MKGAEIRQRFLDFFRRYDHEVVASSSLVPANDPTLLFTNAGMVQFKETFLGQEQRGYKRATSSQRCVRAGGKHNDLENVGYTARHHTFFEMLGNFSFGDYFKREAIHYAWEFLTQDLGLPADRLWVTVYEDDDEAADIWLKELKISPEHFLRLGKKDNFWSMGDTGPCGPCSEIFYDHGQDIPGGPPGTAEEDSDRYVEIWNLVFMQYNRDSEGNLTPLPHPSVDTGMGLERVAAVMQGVHSNYDIDLFQSLIKAAAKLLNVKDTSRKSLNVIADHIRAAAFLITDGVFPVNEGRGYVLRRIIRRAIRHGHQLGARDVFFSRLVQPLIDEMGTAYPELLKAQARIEKVLLQEEQRFAETLEHGMRILEDDIANLKGKVISGATAFQLYDTYGFPVDLTADIARERGLTVDMAGFNEQMAVQRERARSASGFKAAVVDLTGHKDTTTFTGYELLVDKAIIEGLRVDGDEVDVVNVGEEAVVYLDRTPFYAESGGQVGDSGRLRVGDAEFAVRDTAKGHAHIGKLVTGELKVGDSVVCEVDAEKRQATARNHSATHLLHAVLREVLGDHVVQKGSLVEARRLRFDFAHYEAVKTEQIQEIDEIVNTRIRENRQVSTRLMAYDDAIKAGAMALFGEKYDDEVRVVGMDEFSAELCGGTHVQRTGDIGAFHIVSEGGVAAGVRRIEAVTGAGVTEALRDAESALQRIAEITRGSREEAVAKVVQFAQRLKTLEKELEQNKARLAAGSGDSLAGFAQEVKGVRVVATTLDGVDNKGMREALDKLKDKLGSAAVVLASVQDKKVILVAGVTKDLTDRLHAGELIKEVAGKVGGKGGGRADMAQAGGDKPEALEAALADVTQWVEMRLG
ncbi:MAG: alanine--tRNA ligase [Gammaproteobacteria bacterium]|nr:MAG: alanine--tRNA ligase [Gammaproteobacteria bacterium]